MKTKKLTIYNGKQEENIVKNIELTVEKQRVAREERQRAGIRKQEKYRRKTKKQIAKNEKNGKLNGGH